MAAEIALRHGQQRLPDFLGLGAPKCATTWIFRCLAEHPEIHIPAVKEIGFFDFLTEIDHRIPEYQNYFEGAESNQKTGEIYPLYFASERAVERVRRHLPEARLFISLRNPVEQIHSFYWHLRRQNTLLNHRGHHLDLEGALAEKYELIVPHALFGLNLSRWRKAFDSKQIKVIFYDDIKTAPDESIRQLFEFLGVDSNYVPASLGARSARTRKGVSPRSPLVDRIHTMTYNGLNRYIYHPLKNRIGFVAAWKIKEKLRIRQVMQKVFMKEGYPVISPKERALILDIVKDDIRLLQSQTGRDLSAWFHKGDDDA